VRGHLLLTNCLEDELTRPNIELALKEDRLLWLDLQGTDDEVLILIGSLTAFLIFGVGTELVAVICLFVLFKRRGWLGKGS
jgi:type IV secretory pathway TrbD component